MNKDVVILSSQIVSFKNSHLVAEELIKQNPDVALALSDELIAQLFFHDLSMREKKIHQRINGFMKPFYKRVLDKIKSTKKDENDGT